MDLLMQERICLCWPIILFSRSSFSARAFSVREVWLAQMKAVNRAMPMAPRAPRL